MPLSSDRHIIDEKFRDALDSHKVAPSGRVWNRMISDMSEQRQRKISVRNIVWSSVLLFIAASGIWTAINEEPGKTVSLSGAGMASSRKDLSAANHFAGNSSQDIMQEHQKTSGTFLKSNGMPANTARVPDALISAHSSEKNDIETTTVTRQKVIASQDENVYSANANIDKDLAFLPVNLRFLSSGKTDYDFSSYRFPGIAVESDKGWIPDLKGWYTGFSASINSTWILDRAAITNENFKYRTTFGKAYSILAGYNFSNKFGLEAAWVFSSVEGQRYVYQLVNSRSIDISYNQKLIAFNYMQMPVMVKLKSSKWSNITQAPVVVNYDFGIQYGRLLSATASGVADQTVNNSFFRKNEYALIAGIDYDFMTKRSSFLTLGARASYGTNLFNRNVTPDIEFEHPHNFVIGVRAAINLNLMPKTLLPAK